MKPWQLALGAFVLSAMPFAANAADDAVDSGPILALGAVDFANSGSAAAQEPFQRGLALLHSFEFQHAAKAFQEAQAIDPDFAMAYWGEALTENWPIWYREDQDASRKILEKLVPTASARAAKAGTERERAYLAALEIQLTDAPEQERDDAYVAAMADIQRRWPDDVDAAAFHALAILAAEHEGRDVAAYMRAAAILESVYPEHREHPGVLHYMIHSYDDPDHAPLGLRAARRYGMVAPGAAHALHMNSHIFVALGMWPDTIDANRASVAAIDREAAAEGKDKTWCGHAHSWLVYGYLQSGEDAKAREYIDGCWMRAMEQIVEKPADEPLDGRLALSSAFYVQMMDAVQNGVWHVPDGVPWDRLKPQYRVEDAYGRLLAAYHSGDEAATRAAAADLERHADAVLAGLKDKDDTEYWQEPELRAMIAQAKGLATIAAGDAEGGLATLREAADIENAIPVQYGPPAPAKPSDELVGEALLRMDRKAEAAEVYARLLRRFPNRASVLAGVAASGG